MDLSKEIRGLKRILRDIPKDRQPIAQSLFNEISFMEQTLIKLKDQVEAEGVTTVFKNGTQQFVKEHPALKAYNTTIQRYSLLYKQITDLLPPIVTEEKTDPLIDFIKGA
jgi:hypothetical protein